MSSSESTSSGGGGFPSTVRISNLSMKSGGGEPAFVGQVFSMCDLSGTGLMAVSTQFDIPFLSKSSSLASTPHPQPKGVNPSIATITSPSRRAHKLRKSLD
ncbi:tic22-like family protein [Artemisia annua]|uniref:Tic22-like family protein n=1 Tax=Artemisia annua TaxID=35608 RepID=A0A2U1NII7_ARTAN|nr:tic22-like family protein [Artemisia annua]